MYLRRLNPRKTIAELQAASCSMRAHTIAKIHRVQRSIAEPPVTECQFIDGEPTKSEIRKHGADHFKCMAATKPDSAYCPDHHAICFVPLTKASKPPP